MLGLIGIAGTAGCLRLEGDSGTTARTTASSTTAMATDTATATATATEAETTVADESTTSQETETTERSGDPTYPFGLSDDGVEPYLYSTCKTAVSDLAYRSQYTKLDAKSGNRKWHREYEAEGGAALGHWQRKNGGTVDAFHTVGSDMLWREAVSDDYTFGLTPSGTFENIFWDEELQPLLKGPAWSEPERVNEDRPAIWKLTADSVGQSVVSPGHMEGELKSVQGARLNVDENGVIRRVEAVYDASDLEGNVRRQRFQFEVSEIGAVSLSEPSWLESAKERRPRVAARLTDDRRYVRLSVETGAIASGSRISVFDRGDRERKYVGYTDREVGSGDVLYVYAKSDSGKFNKSGIGYGERSATGTPPLLDSEYHLVSFRRDTMYHPGVDVAPPG